MKQYSKNVIADAVWPFVACISFTLLACGGDTTTENITQVTQPGMEVVASRDMLPDCDSKNKGEQVWVKDESNLYVCTGSEWSYAKSTEETFSCETEPLADASGIKIVCNGDSVGVLLEGSAGAKGDNGQNAPMTCKAKKIESTTFVRVICEKDTLIFELDKNSLLSSSSEVVSSSSEESCSSEIGSSSSEESSSSEVVSDSSEGSSSSVELPVDEEARQTSLDSMTGFSQKGPFVKGSNVRLYELTDGRTLKQTNGNFMGVINSNDGFFRISARNLVCQYALLVANGYYKNEVTGETTTEDLTLFALTDVSARSKANVNLLTHLEYDRVYYLVTQEKMKVKAAKKQAQAEILQAFHIDTTGVGNSEDLSVFGDNKGNAALLAISVLLQGYRSIAELTDLLSAISLDLEKDGSLDKSLTVEIADGAIKLLPFLSRIRSNVEGWNLGPVPEFESFVKNFVVTEYGANECSANNEGEKMLLQNANSEYDKTYLGCENGIWRVKMYDPKTDVYYNVAFIGKQVWMAEDLGIPNPNEPGEKVYSVFEYSNIIDSMTFVNGMLGVCPDGWHVPSLSEWEEQLLYVWGISREEAINRTAWYGSHGISIPLEVDQKLRATEGWPDGCNGTDDYGFNVNPGCHADDRYCSKQYFSSTNQYNEDGELEVRPRVFWSTDEGSMSPRNTRYSFLYIRCLKD